ncbi:MAG: enoyl-[acyl-carrier-protein] reductase FabL [candidate division Zixibacteria bacterium HGW-Zixibacteria-1]|nr:MAG: enoyl-[acyl-carrier-protein] reductase FabL [candidate division Zixibacteria bacterium HGW-Zixibacteria-1]
MYPELKGKTALITGAARGFGRAITLRLADEGVNVIVNYRRSMNDANAVVEEAKSRGVTAVAIRADIGKEDQLDKMFDRIKELTGKLDIVVANAAFGVPGSLMDATSKHWDITLAASARSLLDLARRAVPLMNGNYGRIISITSDGGQKVIPGYGVVGPAKAALESITRGLAFELARKGIIVNGVLAGLADTKSARSIPGAHEVIDHAKFHTPAGRIVEPEDIAKVVAFLASDDAAMICGQFIVVDGGRNIVG